MGDAALTISEYDSALEMGIRRMVRSSKPNCYTHGQITV